jgi:signal transduction histidine kinase
MNPRLGLAMLGVTLTLTDAAAATFVQDDPNKALALLSQAEPLDLLKLKSGSAHQVGQLLLSFDVFSSAALAELRQPPVDRGFPVITTLPAVDKVVGRTERSGAIEGGRVPQGGNLGRVLIGRSSQTFVLFSAISLALCVYQAFWLFRSRRDADRLRRRHRAGLTIYEAVKLSLEPDLFATSMKEALASVQEAFEFRSVHLVCLDAKTWTIAGNYGGQGLEDDPAPLVQDFVSELRLNKGLFSHRTLWRYPSHPRWRYAVRRLRYTRSPTAVASIVVPEDQLGVMLVAERLPDRRTLLEDSQILRLTTELFALAIEKHVRRADLNESKRRVEEAQQLKAVGTFADGIAHDFNNLLAAMMGYAEMAIDALDPQSTARDYVENVIEAGAQAQLAIDQILAFTRTRRGQARPFELIEAIIETLPALYGGVTQGAHLHVKVPDPPLAIAGSPIEVQQALINLCKNAGEALQGKGDVALVVDAIVLQAPRSFSLGWLPPGKYVRVAVSDDGVGIAAEHLSRIFEPFFTTKTDSGAGLGLFVVHGIVQSLKGAINVRSTYGVGTCVELFFPQLTEEELPLEPRYELPDVPLGNGELVAIVDPVEASRSRWEEKLAVLGYEPMACETIQALADWCRRTSSRPGVVLVDAQGADGAAGSTDSSPLNEVCWIYACEEGTSLPKSWTARTRRTVLGKPVSLRSLASALDDALGPVPEPQVVVWETAPV